MNLSNLVHQHRQYPQTTSDPSSHNNRHQIKQYRATPSHTSGRYCGREMATALTANPYPGPQPVYTRAPQHPPSPPIDEFQSKCTLPSISSLIGVMADKTSANSSPRCKSSLPDEHHGGEDSLIIQHKRSGSLQSHRLPGTMALNPQRFDHRPTVTLQ